MPRAASKKKTAAKKSAGTTRKKRTRAGARTPGAQALERRPDVELVERTLAMLAQHDRAVGASQREIGEHVLVEYFAGDEALARTKAPGKPLSYAMLAERAEEDTSWTIDELRRAVLAAIVYRGLPSAMRDEIPGSFLYRLAAIDDPIARTELAARIASGDLRGRDADAAIRDAGAHERGGGRPATPAPIRAVSALERLLARAEDDGALDARELRRLEADARTELAARLRRTARAITELASRIDPA